MANAQQWLDAQYSVLGSALIEPKVVPKVVHQTDPEDYSAQNKTVYAAIRQLFQQGKPVDPVTVSSVLGKEYQGYLMQLMEITPTAANIDQYIALCHDQSRIMQAQTLASKILQLDSWEKVDPLLEQLGKLNVDKRDLKITTMDSGLKSFYDRHSKGNVEYLTWPVQALNDRLFAELGDFVIIGGYPSAGKSAWSLQCAWHWAQKYRVGFFSFETSSEKLFDRQMAAVAGISMGDIKRNTISEEQWTRLTSQTTGILARNLELIPAAGMTTADIRAVTLMRRYQIVIIDYVQLIQGRQDRGENRTALVTDISINLHTMAQSLGVTVVGLSQLSRQTKDQRGKAPDLSDLRESGQLEQDADLVMMLSMGQGENPDGDRDLRIRKNKEGTCPAIKLAFDGPHQTFRKADGSKEVARYYSEEGKQKRRENTRNAKTEVDGQMPILPQNTPVPFK